ncbi:HEAT repeat domain-containing protein [Sphingobacterium sp. Mn56C]|uniref:HEAT repeat domain-containing protein n=1 Tax=Sphingobacterium sp. Mn56C TaxID=3395261 RepID=UPI003BE44905
MRKFTFLALLGLCLWKPVPTAAQQLIKPERSDYQTSFAIVVDKDTYKAAKKELEAYKRVLEKRGLGAYLIYHNWDNPEQIKNSLQQLYGKDRLEGAVFVGNIPIPMIRDAQHLSSAFKMDQRINWQRSSVPSDRFYDDFDLQFDFIKQDSLNKQLYYYSLSAESPQFLQLDIYTARIKPTEGPQFIPRIKQYLQKVVQQADQKERLNTMMVYTGHGYHAESLNAWAAEQVALREQFPSMFTLQGNIAFLNFRMMKAMRDSYLSQIQRPDLDIAIYHGHGSDDTQLLNGYAYATAPHPSIENIKRYLRNKIQNVAESKGDVEAAKNRYHTWLDVPLSWMDNALVDSVIRADSLENAGADLHISDLETATPNAKFVMLDACDNGAFHHADYMAAHYAFSPGNTLVTLANSVGVLQDIWPNRLLGILQQGVRMGNWFKQVAYLETHLFGDPTFAFDTDNTTAAAQYNTALQNPHQQEELWKSLLSSADVDLQNMALQQLFLIQGDKQSAQLRDTYFSSPNMTVRLQCLQLLSSLDNADYVAVLKQAVHDPYELTQRLAVQMMGEKGNVDLIPALLEATFNYKHMERVASRIQNVLPFMPNKATEQALEQEIQKVGHLSNIVSWEEQLLKSQLKNEAKLLKDYGQINDSSRDKKERFFSIRTLRAYRYHEAIPYIITLILNENEDRDLRIHAIEALSWFPKSYAKQAIIEACQSLTGSNDLAIKKQAIKTLAILNCKGY